MPRRAAFQVNVSVPGPVAVRVPTTVDGTTSVPSFGSTSSSSSSTGADPPRTVWIGMPIENEMTLPFVTTAGAGSGLPNTTMQGTVEPGTFSTAE